MKTSKQANLWQAINHQRMELSASGRSHFKAVLVLLLKLSVLEELLCKKPSETPYLYKLFNWHGTRSRNIGMEVHMDPLHGQYCMVNEIWLYKPNLKTCPYNNNLAAPH